MKTKERERERVVNLKSRGSRCGSLREAISGCFLEKKVVTTSLRFLSL